MHDRDPSSAEEIRRVSPTCHRTTWTLPSLSHACSLPLAFSSLDRAFFFYDPLAFSLCFFITVTCSQGLYFYAFCLPNRTIARKYSAMSLAIVVDSTPLFCCYRQTFVLGVNIVVDLNVQVRGRRGVAPVSFISSPSGPTTDARTKVYVPGKALPTHSVEYRQKVARTATRGNNRRIRLASAPRSHVKLVHWTESGIVVELKRHGLMFCWTSVQCHFLISLSLLSIETPTLTPVSPLPKAKPGAMPTNNKESL